MRAQVALVILVLLASACASPATVTTESSGRANVETSQGRKVLTVIGFSGAIEDWPGVANTTSYTLGAYVQNYLVVRNNREEFVPQLATEQISVDRGTWRINSDGTMDTIWRIHPNVKWQDGTPFTSDDLLFTFTAAKDPELPGRYGAPLRLMESAMAPDPLTFVVHWSEPYALANEAPGLKPMPRHLLEDAYLHDKANFGVNRWFSTDMIGLGPYKLVRHEPDSYTELTRYDDYHLGRPPLDGIIIKYTPDQNTVLATVVAGAADVVWGKSLPIEAVLEIRQRWEGTGNQVKFGTVTDLRLLELQHRAEYARPRNGLTNRDVRQALYQAIDRPAFVEAVMRGVAPVADSWIAANSAIRADVEASIPQFPYDVARAQRLLEQAGWTRGADGVARDAAGEPFNLRVPTARSSEREGTIIADYWKMLGVQSDLAPLVSVDRETQATQSGALIAAPNGWEFTYGARLSSKALATPANNYLGRNRAGYVNPDVDAIVDELVITIDPRRTLELHRQLLQRAMGDVVIIPLYFQVNPILMLQGVSGPGDGSEIDWNFFRWDKS
jgi:peptide/nickel transport system substrate-binding protein